MNKNVVMALIFIAIHVCVHASGGEYIKEQVARVHKASIYNGFDCERVSIFYQDITHLCHHYWHDKAENTYTAEIEPPFMHGRPHPMMAHYAYHYIPAREFNDSKKIAQEFIASQGKKYETR